MASNFLPEFKYLDPSEQKVLQDKSAEQIEKVGERPLKYMLAFLEGQRQHFKEQAVTESYTPPTSDSEASYNAGRLAGRMSVLDTLIAGVEGELANKAGPDDAAGQLEERPEE